jgi:diguanylate cyclase (GGDEF)-like protein/PAS domain S-box-containing protein
VIVTSSIILGLDLAGLIPSLRNAQIESRLQLCEILAIQTTGAAEKSDYSTIHLALLAAVRRNEEVLSAALRSADGRLLVVAGDHQELWSPESESGSTVTHARVPIFKDGNAWATIEVRFDQFSSSGLLQSLWERPLLRLIAVIATLGFISYALYIRRTLRHLDPSAVIPTRVQAALDVMMEGVLLIDEHERIVLANHSFAKQAGRSPASLMGVTPSSLDWRLPGSNDPLAEPPWLQTLSEARSVTGVRLLLPTEGEATRCFTVNSAPVFDGSGRAKGAIVTFDDVTELEEKSAELEQAVHELEKSQDEIRLQNEELQLLARTDPLTGVANRRYFFSSFEEAFEVACSERRVFSCLMADIDHFKRINDEYGHATGDEVIRLVTGSMKSVIRSSDAICRYGGEEFCIALLDTSIDGAATAAERIRQRIDSPGFARMPVTVSFGVTVNTFGAKNLAELISQADEALFVAKRSGRNRVIRWDKFETIES